MTDIIDPFDEEEVLSEREAEVLPEPTDVAGAGGGQEPVATSVPSEAGRVGTRSESIGPSFGTDPDEDPRKPKGGAAATRKDAGRGAGARCVMYAPAGTRCKVCGKVHTALAQGSNPRLVRAEGVEVKTDFKKRREAR